MKRFLRGFMRLWCRLFGHAWDYYDSTDTVVVSSCLCCDAWRVERFFKVRDPVPYQVEIRYGAGNTAKAEVSQ